MEMDEEHKRAISEVIASVKPGDGLRGATSKATGGKPATSTTVDFTHTISASELKSTYLNLRDDRGRNYGGTFPPHKTKLRVIDGRWGKTYASMHHKNQIWGSIQNWFYENGIEPGDANEAPRSKLRGITELNFEDFSEAEANPVASYGECSSSSELRSVGNRGWISHHSLGSTSGEVSR